MEIVAAWVFAALVCTAAWFAVFITRAEIAGVAVLGPLIGLTIGYLLGWFRVRFTSGQPFEQGDDHA